LALADGSLPVDAIRTLETAWSKAGSAQLAGEDFRLLTRIIGVLLQEHIRDYAVIVQVDSGEAVTKPLPTRHDLRGDGSILGSWRLVAARGGLWRSHLAAKPCFGQLPIPHHALRRNFQDLCGLLYAQPAEETQFDDASFAGIHLC